MANIKLDIFRFDEAVDTVPHRDVVTVDIPETTTVLDALETAKAEVDGIDQLPPFVPLGHLRIVFDEHQRRHRSGLQDAVQHGDGRRAASIKVDPMPNFQPMKRSGRAYGSVLGQIHAAQAVSATQGRRRRSPNGTARQSRGHEETRRRRQLRHVRDLLRALPGRQRRSVVCRPGRHRVRVPLHRRRARRPAQRASAQINEDYLWLCAHCYACSYCPKHVDPNDRIIDVKRATVKDRVMMNERGPRHALIVNKTIKQTGMLAETEVIQGTVGRFNFRGLLKVAPLGLRMAVKGKMPPPFIKPIPEGRRSPHDF